MATDGNFYVYESEDGKLVKRWVCATNEDAHRLLEVLSEANPDRNYYRERAFRIR